MSTPVWAWVAVGGTIAALLVVDLRAMAGRQEVTVRRALVASGAWIAVSVAFGVVLTVTRGGSVGAQYFAAYLLEKSLSIDNILVFAVLFAALRVPAALQHRVLYYGVVGALVARAAFIAAGAALLEDLEWVLYLFGVVVLLAGLRMARAERPVDPERTLMVRLARLALPVTPGFEGRRFVVRRGGRVLATPLLVALVAIEGTDLAFATDSIPAVFGVSRDVFVVFTSNAFAVLGLRALYFVLGGALGRFPYLRQGLAVLLVFIGVKMLATPLVHVPTPVTLGVIALVVATSIGLSLRPVRLPRGGRARPDGEGGRAGTRPHGG